MDCFLPFLPALVAFVVPGTAVSHPPLARYVTMVYFTAVMTQENVRDLVIGI